MMTPDIGGTLQDLPHPKYKDFFAKFAEIDSLPVEQWKPVHLIARFCQLYKAHYNVDYKFKFNSPAPSKCYEIFQIKRMVQGLTKDPVKLKAYIEWAFKEKARTTSKRITSIAFLAHETMLTEYKLKYLSGNLQSQRLDRSTVLPQEYLNIIKSFNHISINNYGDLSFLLQMGGHEELISQLKAYGMDIEAIKRII